MVMGLSWWFLSYLAIFFFSKDELSFFLLYLFHGLGHIFFSFNVGHDALHNAVSKRNKINRLWAYSYDLLGVNTYMWRYMHHQGHHACLNISGEDMSLETSGILRLSDKMERKNYHRYQHLYAPIVYGLYLIYYVFLKDFKYFFSRNNVHLKGIKHPTKEYIQLFLGKFIYLGYMFLLPLLYFSFHWVFIVFTFLFTLFMIGVIMSFTFQATHIVDHTDYPRSKNDHENYVFHVFATTADFATDSNLANFIFGGLNLHVIHHLRSDICHTHYPALTDIVRKTAKEFGVTYRENKTFLKGVRSHLSQLKKLGNEVKTL